MYEKIEKGSTIHIQGLDCNLKEYRFQAGMLIP